MRGELSFYKKNYPDLLGGAENANNEVPLSNAMIGTGQAALLGGFPDCNIPDCNKETVVKIPQRVSRMMTIDDF